MTTIKKYRSEWKYCEDETTLCALRERLAALLPYDSYADESGQYVIHSLYFDDYKDTCARVNVSGEGKRFKYRIRYYGDNVQELWLEKKEKMSGYCHKRKCALTYEEYENIMSGQVMEVFWNTDNKLLKEFCVDIVTKHFMPKVIIDYEREAFVETITNIRITIDRNITASDEVDNFLTGDYLQIPILDQRKHVLEVKFDNVFPSYIKAALQGSVFVQRSFSKYYLGRVAVQENKAYKTIR